MNLCIVGTGYVGLNGAAIFSEWGNNVVGVDIDEKRIERIKKGDMPIYEPDLKEIVMNGIESGRLSFTTTLKDAMKDAEIIFICVGTPQHPETGEADLSYVASVAKEIGQHLDSYKVIVTKSTVPVGTNEYVESLIKQNLKNDVDFDVLSNPEFLREGYSVEDMRNPDRTVIGSNSQKALDVVSKLYDHLDSPIVKCDLRSAEMIKYAANAFLATKISFINEMGQLCERAGADVDMVAHGMGLDTRVGPRFLKVSPGYGGSCFPKDVAALYKTSTDQDYDFKLIRSVMEVNELQKDMFFKKITRSLGENLTGKTFAVLGLAFKERTDDIRESVAIKIARMLRGAGAEARLFDPEAMENSKKTLGTEGFYYAESADDALKGADALVILTPWAEFRELDVEKLKQLNDKLVFDGRNMLDKDQVEAAGLTYFAIGKKTNGTEKIKHYGTYGVLLEKPKKSS